MATKTLPANRPICLGCGQQVDHRYSLAWCNACYRKPRAHEVRVEGRDGARWGACLCGWTGPERTERGAVRQVFTDMTAHTA